MRNILKPGFSNMWTVNFQMFKLVLEKTEVDETGAYYTEWSKSERKTPIQYTYTYIWNSLVAETVKYLPTMQETWIQSPGREDPLEKEMVTHSSILA